MIRAAIYSPYSETAPGAAAMRIHYFKKALLEKGVEVRIFTPEDGEGFSLVRKLVQWNPSWILATSPPLPPLVYVWLASHWIGAHLVLDAKEDGRALAILRKKNLALKERLFLSLRKFLYSHAHEVWFLTPEDRDEATNAYALPSSRLSIVKNGTDSRIIFSSHARFALRRKWGVRKERVLLYAGTTGDEDILGFVNQGFPTPHKENFFLLFILTQDKSEQNRREIEKITNLLHEKGLDSRSRVEVNIPVEKMGEFLSAADAGIIPWREELPTSLPVKIFDYAGTGLPILAKTPNNSALGRFVSKNKTWGQSFESWSDFSHAIEKIKLTSGKTRLSRGKRVHAHWSRESTAREGIAHSLLRARKED